MVDPRTKLDILYQDTLGDITDILTRIEKINTDSGNITTVIEKFNAIEERADKKLDDINSVTKLYNENIYLALIATFLFTAVIGGSVGYFVIKEQLQTSVFENELKKVTDARLKFEEEQSVLMLAKRNGVEFFKDYLVLPTTKPVQHLIESKGYNEGYLVYYYSEKDKAAK